jgi:hypothetical protein
LNLMKKNGGWVQVESFEAGLDRYNKEHGVNEYWQPCRECKPEILEYSRNIVLDYDLSEAEIELMRSPQYRETMISIFQFYGLKGLVEEMK